MRFLLVPALVCSLALSACAPTSRVPGVDPQASKTEQETQIRMAIERNNGMEKRLQNVSWPILKENNELCDDKVKYGHGTSFLWPKCAAGEWKEAYTRFFGDTEYPIVRTLVEGGPGAVAGLREGDELMAINDRQVDTKKRSMKSFQKQLDEAFESGQPVIFHIRRNGAEQDVSIKPERICAAQMVLVPESIINAFTDGKHIAVYTRMMSFAETDNELATVIGHELAHLAMDHVEAKQGNALIGSFFDILFAAATGVNPGIGQQVGMMMYSQEFEQEADYIGLYMTARAGYSIDNADEFWRRMGMEHPDSITHASSHPNTADRFLMLGSTADEINMKRMSGLPLHPEFKEATKETAKTNNSALSPREGDTETGIYNCPRGIGRH